MDAFLWSNIYPLWVERGKEKKSKCRLRVCVMKKGIIYRGLEDFKDRCDLLTTFNNIITL